MQSKYEKEYYGEHSSFANHNFEFGAATKPLCTSFCEQIFYVIFLMLFLMFKIKTVQNSDN